MLVCGNIVLLTVRFFDVAKLTTLTPLSLLISCKISFPIVGLKTSSLPTFALKSKKIFIWYLGNISHTTSLATATIGVLLQLSNGAHILATNRPTIHNSGSPRLYKQGRIDYCSSLRWEPEEAVSNMNSSGADHHGRSSEVVCASLGQM
jgi:hypothetical protein